jgi:DUF177 domain-containing protein
MFLNLKEIRGTHARVDEVYQPGAFAEPGGGPDGLRVLEPVTLGFDIYRDKDEYHLVGTLRGTFELPCSRCLEPFALPVATEFDLRYEPRARNTGEGEREVQGEDLTTAFYDDDRIDLGQLMREQFYLAMPMKPLCRELCQGLCPVCGTNLNTATCDCRRDWVDPRFAALEALRDDAAKRH